MIRFEKVVKRFRRQEILKGLDLTIERGHRVALVGSNGAGKTTLIRCLLGEYRCQGRVTVDGLDPREYREEALSKVGFVPQLPPPLKMPVDQLIRFAAGVCKARPERMGAMALRLGLDVKRFCRQPFANLSGGQKQKLLISIALGRDTEILVMDEPAANLDPEARQIFFELLAERQGSTAMLISSHRLDEVASLVNRVIELDRGLVVLDDRVADLVDLASRLRCRIVLTRTEEAFGRTVTPWGFRSGDGGAAGTAGWRVPTACVFWGYCRATRPCWRAFAWTRPESPRRPRCVMPDRRAFFVAFAPLFLSMYAGCGGDPGTGPVEVKWDRAACDRCRMVLSDRMHSAQIRIQEADGRPRVYLFDDIGCALVWLDDKPWRDDPSTEVWVNDWRTGAWIDALAASYVPGQETPMQYGLGAQAEPADGSFAFAGARARIFEIERRYNVHGGFLHTAPRRIGINE